MRATIFLLAFAVLNVGWVASMTFKTGGEKSILIFENSTNIPSGDHEDLSDYLLEDSEDDDDDDGEVTNEETNFDGVDPTESLSNMLGHYHERNSLKSIMSKIRKLLVETQDKEAFKNILKNINIMNHPDNMDLVEELISGWVNMYEDSSNQDLIRQFHAIQEMIIGDDHVKETILVIIESAQKIFKDSTAQRLVQSIVKVTQKVMTQRDQLVGIVEETRSILNNQDSKLKFLQDLGRTISPMMSTIKLMMSSEEEAPASPKLPRSNSQNSLSETTSPVITPAILQRSNSSPLPLPTQPSQSSQKSPLQKSLMNMLFKK